MKCLLWKKCLQSPALGTLLLGCFLLPASANCLDGIADREFVRPLMQRRWQQLQAQTAYPWGRLRPYGRIEGDTLVLSPDFYQLDREQKRAVFQLLPGVEALGWYQLMTPAEQAQAEQKFSGTMTTLGMLPLYVKSIPDW